MAPQPLLAFEGVSCARGGRMLFEGLSFALGAGEAALVTGPNGAGKSSLIRVSAGLLRPVAGVVEARTPLALLTETAALDGERTLTEALLFWARLDRDRPDPRGRVARAIAALDLASLAGAPVRLLSTGQRRRAAIARVVASEASMWLLDEPANGLDAVAVARLEELIAAHRAESGAVLIATHQTLSVPGAEAITLGNAG